MNDDRHWNPYVAGALSGIVSIGSVWIAGKFIGVSTTFVRTTGMLERLVAPDRIAGMDYFLKEVPKIDWQWMFVAGIFIGSLLAAVASRTFRWQALPATWEERFGPSRLKRGCVAFAGGVFGMFGARLADG